jgi:tetratricopeptide (TPR) repeat protein
VRQTKRFPVEKVLDDLRSLKSKAAQDALDEMILKTLRQMTAAEGEAPEAALKRLAVCRGGFTYGAARGILYPHPLTPSPLHGEGEARGMDDDALDAALDRLQAWQFVTFDGQRFGVDPLVIEAVKADEAAHRPHYDFYHALAWEHDEKQDYLGLDGESANLEAAFEWVMGVGDGEAALWLANACGHFLGNRGRFEQRLAWLERVVKALETHSDNMLRANAQNSLGVFYQGHPTGDKRDNLKRAIAAFEAALEHYTPQASPLNYAATQNNLGVAYGDLAQIEARVDNLRRAIAAFEAALEHYTPQASPLDYAVTQRNLGIIQKDIGDLPVAVACWRAAETYYRQMGDVEDADLMRRWIEQAEGRGAGSEEG